MRERVFGERPRFVDCRTQRFVPDAGAAKGRCFLDGIDVTDERVYYASEASGEIRCYALRDGEPYTDPETGSIALAPPRFGVVDIYLDGEEVPTA